jgi:hypothetical protein
MVFFRQRDERFINIGNSGGRCPDVKIRDILNRVQVLVIDKEFPSFSDDLIARRFPLRIFFRVTLRLNFRFEGFLYFDRSFFLQARTYRGRILPYAWGEIKEVIARNGKYSVNCDTERIGLSSTDQNFHAEPNWKCPEL